MLVIVARALAVRPSTGLGPSSKIQWVVGTRATDLDRPANINRPVLTVTSAEPEKREG